LKADHTRHRHVKYQLLNEIRLAVIGQGHLQKTKNKVRDFLEINRIDQGSSVVFEINEFGSKVRVSFLLS